MEFLSNAVHFDFAITYRIPDLREDITRHFRQFLGDGVIFQVVLSSPYSVNVVPLDFGLFSLRAALAHPMALIKANIDDDEKIHLIIGLTQNGSVSLRHFFITDYRETTWTISTFLQNHVYDGACNPNDPNLIVKSLYPNREKVGMPHSSSL